MTTFLITLVVMALAILGMGMGLILSGGRKPLKGSCGGPTMNPNCCLTCPEKEACDEADARRLPREPELAQIRSTSHAASGPPVASPNQIH